MEVISHLIAFHRKFEPQNAISSKINPLKIVKDFLQDSRKDLWVWIMQNRSTFEALFNFVQLTEFRKQQPESTRNQILQRAN